MTKTLFEKLLKDALDKYTKIQRIEFGILVESTQYTLTIIDNGTRYRVRDLSGLYRLAEENEGLEEELLQHYVEDVVLSMARIKYFK